MHVFPERDTTDELADEELPYHFKEQLDVEILENQPGRVSGYNPKRKTYIFWFTASGMLEYAHLNYEALPDLLKTEN